MKYIILEKAKPYKRTRRGKFESVSGYQSKLKALSPEERRKFYAPWGGRFEKEHKGEVFVPSPKRLKELKDIERKAQLTFPFLGKARTLGAKDIKQRKRKAMV